jgi:cyclomaltodextrinase / maltogenic alpha-amylase / neopullulanase
MTSWHNQAVFYHIYPLGALGAPLKNNFCTPPTPRLANLHGWLDSIQSIGANALYIGPLFESTAHGYDTLDYFHVDRRLGTDETLMDFSRDLHGRGMHLVLDAVFNHVGRDFWAFKDVQLNGESSQFVDWFAGIRFDQRSPYGDEFSYQGWSGHFDLVKLNLSHPDVRNHLFAAVQSWMDRFEIDGLRLDAADALDLGFIAELSAFCRRLRPDFWLMGEVVHGDYSRWANPPAMLDSTTNYECYKGLYSSLNDHNYFEIAYGLNRQSGPAGLYRHLQLYNFADNHDVNRLASNIQDARHLFPLYLMLFTMPGIPSIYYGSEFGLTGKRDQHSDQALRPVFDPRQVDPAACVPDLAAAIRRFADLRQALPALQMGDYHQIHVQAEQMAFLRQYEDQQVLIVFNSAPQAVDVTLKVADGTWSDLLNGNEMFVSKEGKMHINLASCWGRVLVKNP